MKGALITGNILDIIEIVCILVILLGLLQLAGFGLTDMFSVAGNAISTLAGWFGL